MSNLRDIVWTTLKHRELPCSDEDVESVLQEMNNYQRNQNWFCKAIARRNPSKAIVHALEVAVRRRESIA